MKKTIFFIEDDPHFLKDVGAALAAEGFAVKTALDGEAGLKLFLDGRPDLVLLDLILPKRDGFEVLKELKKDPKTAALPVMVLTNLENSGAVDRALALGASAYLVKTSYRLEDVVARIKALLGR